jgi:hypothetical protein
MSTQDSELADRCRATAAAAGRATKWFEDNKEQVRQEQASLLREFRKFSSAATKLAAAVERPMCVGVFGPSQAGKSYLISALARRGTNPLIADFGEIPGGLDFVRQINPEGGAESTGLVTRFSMRRVAAPPGFPVPVRLLSHADVVKIIGNTFFSDCDLSEEPIPDAASIGKLAEEVRRSTQSAPVPSMTEDDVWDIQEYFERQFKGVEIVKALSSGGYWTMLAELAPRATLPSRAALFSMLWGGIEPFSALYVRLIGALDKLGHAAEAFCEIEALVARTATGFERRTGSVIDVGTLRGLGSEAGETLMIRAASGATTAVTRPVLTALIAELHVAMHERPWDFLEHTDLLDFPGARSREIVENVRRFLTKDGALEGLFLRGKVAYLFERYNVEQELTGMLLCIGPSNQEVRTVPGMVKDWIDLTHGADPEARSHAETALFFVLTKFDAEFEEKEGEDQDSTARWTRRLNTSLIDFFGKAHRWPHEWTPGRPFDNCFWLRNPNFKAKHILDYDDAGKELGIRQPHEAKRIERQRGEYLANPLVRQHFRDPAKAWDEAFRLNDGGVTYLAESIAPVCNPQIKIRQISARLDVLQKTMRVRLQRYYVSDDLGEQREQRKIAAREVVRHLLRCASDQRFGGLMRVLQSSDIELGDVFFNLETKNGRDLPRGRRIDGGRLSESLGLDADIAISGTSDLGDHYANAAVEHWVGSIRSLANNPRVCQHFRLTETTMSNLVDELIAGSVRLDLRKRVARGIRPTITPQARFKDRVVKSALLAADEIGAFVFWLGYDEVLPAQRPAQRATPQVRIFQEPTPVDFPQLEEQPSSFDERFYGDWFTAYFDFVSKNADSIEGRLVDIEQNNRIGAIIAALNSNSGVAARS